MDRRDFLRHAAAATPLAFGLESLFAQDPVGKPVWLSDALEFMKTDEVRGIVVVVPDAAPDRAELGRALWKRLDKGGATTHALFLQGIFVFVTKNVAQQFVQKELQPWDRVVLGPDGATLKVDRIGMKVFRDDDAFEESMTPVVLGEGLGLLLKREEKVWSTLAAEVKEALGRLGHEEPLTRQRAKDLVKARTTDVLPCLIHRALLTPESEERSYARKLVDEHYRMRLSWDLDPWARGRNAERRERTGKPIVQQLPYGVALPGRIHGGCGVTAEEPPEGEKLSPEDCARLDLHSGALCGMASMRDVTYTFVKFLAK